MPGKVLLLLYQILIGGDIAAEQMWPFASIVS
jgi:hypothetical protein